MGRGLQSGSRLWTRASRPCIPNFTRGPAGAQGPSWLRSQAAKCWPRAPLAGLWGSPLGPKGESRQTVRWASGMQLGRHPQEGRPPPRKHRTLCADASLRGTGLVWGEPQCASACRPAHLVHPRGHGLLLPTPRPVCPLCPSILADSGLGPPS